MRCSVLLAMAWSLLWSAQAHADIVTFPKRPDWDTPVPMPAEVGWLVVVVVLVLAAFVRGAMEARER